MPDLLVTGAEVSTPSAMADTPPASKSATSTAVMGNAFNYVSQDEKSSNRGFDLQYLVF